MWLVRLADIRRQYAGNPGALEAVARAERLAAHMLELAREDAAALGDSGGEHQPPAG